MNKTILPLIFSVTVLLLLAQPAQALSVFIDSNGYMSFQAGEVLGKDSESEVESEPEHSSEPEEVEKPKEVEKEVEHQEQKTEEVRKEVTRAPESKERRGEKQPELKAVLKNVSARENKLLKIKNSREKTEVSVEKKTKEITKERKAEKLSPDEKVETDSVNIELPVNQKPEAKSRPENEAREINEEIRKIKLERSQRRDKLDIKSEVSDDGSHKVEIESGAIKAKLESAEFTVDPTTNNLEITTRNGETHTLIHLPDQALQQMVSTEKLKASDSIDQSQLTIETKEDGAVVYKTRATSHRKLFGFIPFTVENEVELNDATSEISTQATDTSFMGKLLMQLSR